jgi:hypothetical protein
MFVEYSGLNVFLKGLNPDFKLITANTVKATMFITRSLCCACN